MVGKFQFCMFLAIGVAGLLIVQGKWVNAVNKPLEEYPIKLEINSESSTYRLAESVTFNISLANTGDSPINLPMTPNVFTGYLWIWIARPGDEFRRYNNSSWGKREMPGITLKPNQPYQTKADILWNSMPQIPRPDSEFALKDFAFPEAGVYFIKAVLTIPNRESPDDRTRIESPPIQITVGELFGEDLEVWNQIKDSGEIAAFLQRGSFLTSNNEEEAKLIGRVRQIVADHSNSSLAARLGQKLTGFRTMEEKRKEIIRKFGTKPVN